MSGGTGSAPGSRAPRSAPASSGPRFCGVCGARITGAEAFCGQCGSPITAGPTAATGVPSGPGRYQVGPDDWGTADAEAYTEALPEPPSVAAGRNPYINDQYARSYAPGYGATPARPGATGGMSRSTKITLGSLCLGASVLIAIITITLAVIWFSA